MQSTRACRIRASNRTRATIQNRLGGNVGGHIIKNKLFYFGDFEYNPTGLVSSAVSGLVSPTAAGYATLAALPGVSATNLKIVQQYSPVAPTADQGTQPYSLPNGGTIKIPIGTPNITAPNFQNWFYAVASMDYNLSDNDQIRGRFIYNKNTGFSPSNQPELPAFYLPVPLSITWRRSANITTSRRLLPTNFASATIASTIRPRPATSSFPVSTSSRISRSTSWEYRLDPIPTRRSSPSSIPISSPTT